jgi:hypothetical protein
VSDSAAPDSVAANSFAYTGDNPLTGIDLPGHGALHATAHFVSHVWHAVLDYAACLHVSGTEDDVFVAESLRVNALKQQVVPVSNKLESPGTAIINMRKYVQLPLW